MLILSLDTSTDNCAVAISRGEELLLEKDVCAPREHMRILLPLIDSMLAESGLDILDIEAIAVGLGPGSFTGLRIGVSVAKGLAMGLGRGIIGISSLDIIAEGAKGAGGLILAAADAKRKEIYTALYAEKAGRLQRLTDYEAVSPSELLGRVERMIKTGPLTIVGSALFAYGYLFDGLSGVNILDKEKWLPSAASLGSLAFMRIEEGATEDPLALSPIYVRVPIAEEMLRKG